MANPFSGNNVPPSQPHTADNHYVRASDVGTFLYCRRAWWLERIVGWQPGELPRRARGTIAHQRHGWWVWLSQLLRTIAITLAVVGLGALALVWYGWVP